MLTKISQDRHPNFRGKEGKLFLVRCYACENKYGRENHSMAVAAGQCAWCGWKEEKEDDTSCQESKETR